MKYLSLSIIILISLTITNPNYTSFQSSSSQPFKLQSYNNNMLKIFSVTNPVNVIVEVNVTKQTTTCYLNYLNKIGDKSYMEKSLEIVQHGYYNLTLDTNDVKLLLNNNFNNYANYTATGYYRIHQGQYNPSSPWKSYNLSISKPDQMILYKTTGGWVDNISISVNIVELSGGTLDIYHSISDAFGHREITEPGIYNDTLNTTYIGLSLVSTNYTRASGYYTVIDHGQLYKNSADGFQYFIVMLTIIVVVIVKKRKRLNS